MTLMRVAALSCLSVFSLACLGQPGDAAYDEEEDALGSDVEQQSDALTVGGDACSGWTGCYRFCTLAYQACQRREGANSPRCIQNQVNCLNTCDSSFPQCW